MLSLAGDLRQVQNDRRDEKRTVLFLIAYEFVTSDLRRTHCTSNLELLDMDI